ncbi:DUF302 domain-containing protein [Desulfoplanes formicivorans]|uniref:Membrane protein n=1 Tax=Desulfoplanes formicivorans TaxID=1592317 RepID=A0A194AFQ2_9BACT|nr:DUF302 domain-containing protein [Desulfoplanes formicivorans]GAU08158.1 membrane protein [Desulfoplanes formicivorans]
MKKMIMTTCLILFFAMYAQAADGVINVQSASNVKETADRMENILKEKGMTVFNRIQHSEGANTVGIKLRDTELILFGNPKVGSPLIKCQQSVAIDLPQKALIWEDDNGHVWISYNDPKYLAQRHVIVGCEDVLLKIEKALSGIANAAAMK